MDTVRPVVGCDAQAVAEVADAVNAFGKRYLDRVYTDVEQQQCSGAEPLARRFAAKEAVIKVIGSGDGVDPRSIEIVRTDSGRPAVRLSGRAAELAREGGVGDLDISLSSSGGIAFAVATAFVRR